MRFPRNESCSSFGRLARCRTEDNEEISLCSSFNVVIVSEMGAESAVISFVETAREVSDGNWYVRADIYPNISMCSPGVSLHTSLQERSVSSK